MPIAVLSAFSIEKAQHHTTPKSTTPHHTTFLDSFSIALDYKTVSPPLPEEINAPFFLWQTNGYLSLNSNTIWEMSLIIPYYFIDVLDKLLDATEAHRSKQ